MKRALGNWVVGDRFWDREQELKLNRNGIAYDERYIWS
jgi:hypothetical protein